MFWQQIAERLFFSYDLPEYEFKKEAALRDSHSINFAAEIQTSPGIAIDLIPEFTLSSHVQHSYL
jgi:hypothetical protein